MKKIIFTLFFLHAVILGFSQTTYYWVGGATGNFNTVANWNTALDGSGSPLGGNPSSTDILVVDGTNIGGGTPGTGPVIITDSAGYTIAQLKLQNGADATLYRVSSTGGVATGTTTLTIGGDGTAANDLTVDASSTLRLTSVSNPTAQGFVLALNAAATGSVDGTVRISDGGFAKVFISVFAVNALTFNNGSNCYVNNTFAASYPLSPSGGGTFNNGILFQSGSTFIFLGGNSPFTTTSTAFPMSFATGSTFIMEAAAIGSNVFNRHTFSHVIIRNNAVINNDGAFYNIDNFTVNAGSTFNLALTGNHAVSGNILNNGTIGSQASATTGAFIMDGITPQTISGSGVFNAIAGLSVATDANVTVNNNLIIGSTSSPSTSTITGKLNMQTYTLSSTGTTVPAPINFKSPASITTTSSATITSASNTITFPNATIYNAANVGIGNLVTGPGIPANTYIIGTTSASFLFTMSKAATATAAGATVTISNTGATLTTANPGGIDGTVTTTGTRSFGSGSNYVFNGATTAPFSLASGTTAASFTFNSSATTNRTMNISSLLTLNSGKLTIRATDTLRVTVSGNIGGTFNASQYIATAKSGANVGVLRIDSFTTAKTFPIGSPNYYMPVTLTPTTVSTFCTSVFEGITNEGTANGTPFTAPQKEGVVDAVWTLNRTTANTGDNCTVDVSWQAAQEGVIFPAYGDAIGIARHDGTSWLPSTGSGVNTLNTATSSFTSFSPFAVGQRNILLPVKLLSFSAKPEQGKVKLQWITEQEINTATYTVERSVDGRNFSSIATVNAAGSRNYSATDNSPLSLNFYRLKISDKNGGVEYSSVIRIQSAGNKAGISVFPNPVNDRNLNVQLNNYAAGKISFKLYSNEGRLVLTENVQYSGGSQVQTIHLPASMAKGVYRLVAETGTGIVKQTVMVE